jgi:hypothetical protein
MPKVATMTWSFDRLDMALKQRRVDDLVAMGMEQDAAQEAIDKYFSLQPGPRYRWTRAFAKRQPCTSKALWLFDLKDAPKWT